MSENVNHYEQERRQKSEELRKLGIDPYGGREEGVRPLLEVKETYKPEMGHDGGPAVKVAGRIVLKRDMGKKLSFLTLQDDSGQLQVALDRKRLGDTGWGVRDLLDLGDQIVVEGVLGVTNKGETTVWGTHVRMAAKALLPPPAKWEGLSDVEIRYRQRYVDLWANPEVMRTMKLRMRVVQEVRKYLSERGFLEVETPMMQTLAGGAAARPFVTHHNALDMPLYMRIAPELYLKRLLVGGFTKVFELNRNFRNEGISPRHNPEFTMLEAYEAFGSWETMADLVEGMICHLAESLFGGLKIEHKDPKGMEAVQAFLGRRDDSSLQDVCRARLDLLFAREHAAKAAASPAELYARKTASEGYADDQDGFKSLIAEYQRELEEATAAERQNLLAAKFVTKVIDLSQPWRRVSMVHLVEEKTGWKFDKNESLLGGPTGLLVGWKVLMREVSALRRVLPELEFGDHDEDSVESSNTAIELMRLLVSDDSKAARELLKVDEKAYSVLQQRLLRLMNLSPAEQLVEVYEKLIEHRLVDPTFVTHVPSVIIPLARKNKDDPFFADVYELAINGQEISPGYSELNDPDVQAANFTHQVGDKEEQQKTDEDFLTALKYGMPPAGGMGLGIDRLVMMLTGAESIRDVILFPFMRPHAE